LTVSRLFWKLAGFFQSSNFLDYQTINKNLARKKSAPQRSLLMCGKYPPKAGLRARVGCAQAMMPR
jgi:hypothetical protein